MFGFLMGVLSGDFTPHDFFQDNVGKRVGIYTVRLWTEFPVTDKIIGAKVYLTNWSYNVVLTPELREC